MSYYTQFYLLWFNSYPGNTDRVVNIFYFGIVKLTFRKGFQVISIMCRVHSGPLLEVLCVFREKIVVPFASFGDVMKPN